LIIAFPVLVFFIIGTANAVNLTDGQDGLAGKTILVHLFFLFTVFGNNDSVLVLIAALLAFLLFNTKPATIYMGDSGSLFLGAFLAISFLNAKIEYLLPLTGLVFVVETLSVIIQVTYFRATKGRRIFKMSPFHHHLELCNISEEKITNLAFITTIITCFVAYFLIK
jgi:phospho-N-acetylmuramoyl-pentapeptide-transferase